VRATKKHIIGHKISLVLKHPIGRRFFSAGMSFSKFMGLDRGIPCVA
jgi:hypothetical protein